MRNDVNSPATVRKLLITFFIATPVLGLTIWAIRGIATGVPLWGCLLASALFSGLAVLLRAGVERHGRGGWGWPSRHGKE